MVVAEQHDTQPENYSNVLETSRLRPEVEPFVPKALPHNGHPQHYYMLTNGGFSLDAPEFVPNVYGSNGEVYAAWVTPNQFIVAPATNHPRYSIPRFRDKFMRQHRNRTNSNNNVRPNYNNNHRYENEHHPQQRTYHKIEQRQNKSRDNYSHSNGSSTATQQKQITIETKRDNKNEEFKELQDVLVPVVIPHDIDEGIMSYRAALLGNSSDPVKPDTPKPTPPEHKASPPEKKEPEPCPVDRQTSDNYRPTRSDRRTEKFIPSEGEQGAGYNKYNGRGGGRQKPTKGSEIQLNIFSLVQDKKVKKKKVSKSRDEDRQTGSKAVNQLDSTAPALRRGKEREEGKTKKLSKMKKIIVKEKSEITENGGGEIPTSLTLPEYCSQSVTVELNNSLAAFLTQLRQYNDKAFKIFKTGSVHKKRYCCGLREARKYLKLNKVKCIVIPPNIDKIVTKGGLYDCVHDIISLSTEQNVPIFYGLNKTKISKILARPKSTVTSAVSVFNYHGAETLWESVLETAAIARERYQEEYPSEENTIKEEDDESSDEGEEFDEDNNEEEDEEEAGSPGEEEEEGLGDNESVSSSLVDSGIENNEISSLSIDNGHTSGEG